MSEITDQEVLDALAQNEQDIASAYRRGWEDGYNAAKQSTMTEARQDIVVFLANKRLAMRDE